MSSPEGDLTPIRSQTLRVGAELRAARLQYGWDLEAVAASLRIRVAYLQAIEAGRVADLPGNAYALGFLRTYATALGLDADEMCRRFRAEVAELNTKTELTFPAPVPERGVPAGAVILLGVVLAVGAYIGWYHLAEHLPSMHTAQPVPPDVARLAEPTALAPKPVPAPPPASSAPAPTTTAPTTPAITNPAGAPGAPSSAGTPASGAGATSPPPTTAPATPVVMPPPASGATVTKEATAAPAAASQPPSSMASAASPLAAVSALAPPAQAAPAASGRIVVRATAESWVEVKDSTGTVIFTKLLQPGETWTAPPEPGLTLTTGNAGGTELVVDGQVGAPLGAPGEVERNQPLDAGLIKAGALPAQIAAAAAPDAGHSAAKPQP